ncbi:MAG: hypothetical protein COC17_07630 [Hyphomicrobiales bacterium]|nr:HlyC/CorC family transporter [Hyphomicrobiales bacterium]PCH49706.1 MAG: hypothetical protein COC17_07630 [Hyphomicrobiales bacterium]
MTTTYWILTGVIILLIIISAFFSGSETALTAASRARLHQLEKNGNKKASIANRLIAKRDRLLGAILIGNNLVNILASSIATSVFLKLFGEAGIAIATLAMTIIIVIFAEVMPKSWALAHADKVALAIAPIMRIIAIILWPITVIVTGIVKVILRWFGIKLDGSQGILSSHDELRGAVDLLHKDGAMIKDDRDRFGGVLDLHELEVSDVMVHRTSMVSIDIDQTNKEIIKQILSSPFTRIPFWKDTSENIIGVLHTRDLLRVIGKGEKFSNIDFVKITNKPWFVPETTPLRDQLNAFLRRKAHIAIVVDEYGEMLGIVTLEDILEEIVGEIADEHDLEVVGVTTEPDGSVVVNGDVPIRDLNRALEWELPDDEATTIAGLVIHAAQMIPEEKQAFTFYGMRFVILKRSKNRVASLRIRKISN